MQATHFQCCHNHLKSICFQERASTTSGTNVHYLLDSCHVTVSLRCHITCWVGCSQSSHYPEKFVGLPPCKSGDITFLIGHVITISYPATLIEVHRYCFNVGKTTMKQCAQKYVDSASMNQCCFNVDIWLKMKVEPMYVYPRFFNDHKSTLKQL